MKKVLLTIGIVSFVLMSFSYKATAFTIAHPCQTVLNHLETLQEECSGCIAANVTLIAVGIGGSPSCRLEGVVNNWPRSRLDEKFEGVRGSDAEELAPAFEDYDELEFSYDIPDASVFTNYNSYQISHRIRFGIGRTETRIYFTEITYDGPVVITFGSPPGDAGGGGGDDEGGGGGGGGDEDITCQRIFNCDGSETLCQEAEDGCVAVADVALCNTTVEITPNCSPDEGPRPPGTETLRNIDEANLNTGAGGGTGGGICALNTKATPSGFGFGLLALLLPGLVVLRRFPRSTRR